MGEAKKMKENIGNIPKAGGSSGGGGGAKGNSGGGGDDKKGGDPEDDKFKTALSNAIVTEKPNVSWDDVAGLEAAKRTLREAIILPIKFPEIFVGIREPWKGILLYGPPGTGKSYLAKACATMADGTFFSISSSDLISKWVGESEKLIKALFEMARENQPAIIFIDEIDSMVSARSDDENEASRRVKTEFLVQMQGVGNKTGGVLVLGATNYPWGLDPAIRRRFEKRVYISLPDVKARIYLIKHKMAKQPNNIKDSEYDEIGARTEGFSGSDINTFVVDACNGPLRKTRDAQFFRNFTDQNDGLSKWMACSANTPGAIKKDLSTIDGNLLYPMPVEYQDFLNALCKVKKTVSAEDLAKQDKWTAEFGMEG